MASLLAELFAIEADFGVDRHRQQRGLDLLLLDPSHATVLVARSSTDGAVLGMVTGQLVISTAQGAPSLWAEDLIVRPQDRARGIAHALLAALLVWGCARGATRAQLLADARNAPALAFYDHLAWQPTHMIARRLHFAAATIQNPPNVPAPPPHGGPHCLDPEGW